MKNLLLIALLTLTAPCGGAIYTYVKIAPDGSICALKVESRRDVQEGSLNIDENCAVTGGAESLRANKQAIEAISKIAGTVVKAAL